MKSIVYLTNNWEVEPGWDAEFLPKFEFSHLTYNRFNSAVPGLSNLKLGLMDSGYLINNDKALC